MTNSTLVVADVLDQYNRLIQSLAHVEVDHKRMNNVAYFEIQATDPGLQKRRVQAG